MKEKRKSERKMVQACLLHEGFGFGELALINFKPRAATVVAVLETHLAAISRDYFKKVLAKFVTEQIKFFK